MWFCTQDSTSDCCCCCFSLKLHHSAAAAQALHFVSLTATVVTVPWGVKKKTCKVPCVAKSSSPMLSCASSKQNLKLNQTNVYYLFLLPVDLVTKCVYKHKGCGNLTSCDVTKVSKETSRYTNCIWFVKLECFLMRHEWRFVVLFSRASIKVDRVKETLEGNKLYFLCWRGQISWTSKLRVKSCNFGDRKKHWYFYGASKGISPSYLWLWEGSE